ncbi:DUF4383 domain-containing protein [Lentzea sp. NPDC060358]|uniref:DUF4383 domain-containing protein n=1 Tax=Lentzea sp. NPDC060358 TaxID=3347103 RepID=UPI0036651088
MPRHPFPRDRAGGRARPKRILVLPWSGHAAFGVIGFLMSRTAYHAYWYLLGGGVVHLMLWLYGLLPASSVGSRFPRCPADVSGSVLARSYTGGRFYRDVFPRVTREHPVMAGDALALSPHGVRQQHSHDSHDIRRSLRLDQRDFRSPR